MNGAARFGEVNLIADPLYGYIEITKGGPGGAGERHLLDDPWLQRLRRIHQLQSAWWVFPTAEHSRFAHLLGAMHLASVFARRVDGSLRESFPDAPSPACVEETLRIAGLVHDIGHGPFGHFFDREVLHAYGSDHEVIGRRLVTSELADIIASLRSSPSGPFAAGEFVDPAWVSWVMAPAEVPGYVPPPWLAACKPLLCGPATVDNLDYVPRDAYMCGVSVGPVDVRRLVHYSFVHDNTIVLHGHATAALEMFLTARLYMYTQVYMHRTGRRFDLSMREIFSETIARILPGDPLDMLDDYRFLTDWSLLETVQRWQRWAPGSPERRLGDAWAALTRRELPWRLVFETIMPTTADVSGLRDAISDQLPASMRAGRFEVDVASTSVAPHNPMHDQGMVAIYDPLQETVLRSRTSELIARLPQYSQVVRVFTPDPALEEPLARAARTVSGDRAPRGLPAPATPAG